MLLKLYVLVGKQNRLDDRVVLVLPRERDYYIARAPSGYYQTNIDVDTSSFSWVSDNLT